MAEVQKKSKLSDGVRVTKSATSSIANADANSAANIVLFFVPARIQKKRLQIMKDCAKKHGYSVEEELSERVSHLVTEFETKEQVLRSMNNNSSWCELAEIVSSKWFTDTIKSGSPLPVSNEYKIKSEKPIQKSTTLQAANQVAEGLMFNKWLCQRKSMLKHHNHVLTDALEVVAKHAELRDEKGDYPRALAFRKAAAALKSLPFAVTQADQISSMKDIGKHSLTIIQEILEDKYSAEVENIRSDDWFKSIELFSTVYGIGPAIAKQYYSLGVRSLKDAIERRQTSTSLNFGDSEKINYGLAFHKELTTPLSKKEADFILDLVKEEAEKLLPAVSLVVTGGFRRGKPAGHDLDILISHPDQGKEIGLLGALHDALIRKGLILYGYVHRSTFTEDMLKDDSQNVQNSTMDHFEKCFYILRLPTDGSRRVDKDPILGDVPVHKADFETLCRVSSNPRNWKVVRVDLITCPWDQYAYALVGWTGNKQFNRSIRHYAKKKMNMRLTSHGLWSFAEQRCLPAATEKDVFSNLKLDYLEPWERNA